MDNLQVRLAETRRKEGGKGVPSSFKFSSFYVLTVQEDNSLAYIILDEQSASGTQEKHRGKGMKISGVT